jgi:DNA-binding CsgD family transcriptional regulator
MLDQTAQRCLSNRAARGVLARADCVRVSAGRFEVADRLVARRLRRVLASASSGTATALAAGSCAPLPPLQLLVRRLDGVLDAAAAADSRFIVFLNDLSPPQQDDHRAEWRSQFGFTAREAELAQQLLSGASVAEAAAHLGMSVNTARWHLKAIFRKTGTSRQAALMRVQAAPAELEDAPRPDSPHVVAKGPLNAV